MCARADAAAAEGKQRKRREWEVKRARQQPQQQQQQPQQQGDDVGGVGGVGSEGDVEGVGGVGSVDGVAGVGSEGRCSIGGGETKSDGNNATAVVGARAEANIGAAVASTSVVVDESILPQLAAAGILFPKAVKRDAVRACRKQLARVVRRIDAMTVGVERRVLHNGAVAGKGRRTAGKRGVSGKREAAEAAEAAGVEGLAGAVGGTMGVSTSTTTVVEEPHPVWSQAGFDGWGGRCRGCGVHSVVCAQSRAKDDAQYFSSSRGEG